MPAGIDLTSQIAWVTGGASGIGRAVARHLAIAGARVVSLDVADPPDDVHIRHVHLDVRDSAAVERVAGQLEAEGLEPDILVNAAGITRDGVVWKLGDRDWEDVLDINLSGAFRTTRACAPGMRRRGRGAIVNIASINGLRGKFGQSNYAASKGGLIAFTKAVATELARAGIRVNAVAPGFIDTPMTSALPENVRRKAEQEILLGRPGHVDEVAHAVLFLSSPLAAFITGEVLIVDGGQSLGTARAC